MIAERFDNIKIDELFYYYLRVETKEEYQEETTKNKANKLLVNLQRDSQSKEDKKIYSRVEALNSFSYFVKEIAKDSQLNICLKS